jgi:hypothetical protein
MNKRILISEEEKRRILDMHKNLSLKPILEQYSKEKDILNEKGQYITQGDVTFRGQEIGQGGGKGVTAELKLGTVVWGDERFNAITFWNNLQRGYAYRELLTIKCDSNKVIGKLKDDSGNWVDRYEYIYTDPVDFIGKMKSMFCCGTKLKPDTDRPGSKAWAKLGEDGYKCKGSQVSPTKKCPSGIPACPAYKDCSQSQHYHKCDKCEKIKEVQRCLAKKLPTLGIKDDGYWGCKTQDALNQLKMGESLTPEQITMLCTETLG